MAEHQLKDGIEERPEETAAQMQKEEAADMYDTFDMRVDRHWSEKKVSPFLLAQQRVHRFMVVLPWLRMHHVPVGHSYCT